MPKIDLIKFFKMFLPPIFILAFRRVLNIFFPGRIYFSYAPEGWSQLAHIRGWDNDSGLKVHKAKWYEFKKKLEGNGPLGINLEANKLTNLDLVAHNTIMSFGYVMALAARDKNQVSILDWGGAIGHYALISKTLFPNTKIDFFCRDLPILCNFGREVLPDVSFFTSDSEFSNRKFDLVMASGSLQCIPSWKEVLEKLALATNRYLYVTRLSVTLQAPSYVSILRPYNLGYRSEYLTWCLNRDEFLQTASKFGMRLIREFLISEMVEIAGGAPAPTFMRGYLFHPG